MAVALEGWAGWAAVTAEEAKVVHPARIGARLQCLALDGQVLSSSTSLSVQDTL